MVTKKSVLVLSFEDTKPIASKVSRKLKGKYETVASEKFPDGEFNLSIKSNPKGKTVVIVSSMALNPNQDMIKTILLGGIAKDFGAKKVILVATYFPYMRQDTHFYNFDSFSSKYVTKLFLEFDKVITLDPHLHRIKNLKILSDKLSHITVNKIVADYIKKKFKNNFTIVGPDGESSQWNEPVAKMLGKEVVVLKKQRFSSFKIKVHEEGIHKFEKHVILIDDIISTGRTLSGALALARKQGARKLYCIGIHGLLVGNAVELITKHAKLITTNTIPTKFSKIDVSPAIVEELKRVLK